MNKITKILLAIVFVFTTLVVARGADIPAASADVRAEAAADIRYEKQLMREYKAAARRLARAAKALAKAEAKAEKAVGDKAVAKAEAKVEKAKKKFEAAKGDYNLVVFKIDAYCEETEGVTLSEALQILSL